VVLELAKCISCIYTRYCYWCEDANAYGENTYVPMMHTYVYSYIYSIYIYTIICLHACMWNIGCRQVWLENYATKSLQTWSCQATVWSP
jgi:hypothetical protein